MKRDILCANCGAAYRPHPADTAMGFRVRFVKLSIRKPEKHGITENGEFQPLATIVCDHCGASIVDGSPAVALTMWNTNREGTPGLWEHEFGSIGNPR